MKQNEFADVRDFLGMLRSVLSDKGIVSVSWNGDILTVLHAIPETSKRPFAMRFDNPMEDYQIGASTLILEFIAQSSAYFANTPDDRTTPGKP